MLPLKNRYSKHMQYKFQHGFKSFLEIRKTERTWHFPLLAGICVGLCLLVAGILTGRSMVTCPVWAR